MTPQIIFKIANLIVLPAWLLLIIFPRAKVTTTYIKSGRVSLVLSVIYFISLALHRFHEPQQGGFSSLEDVRLLFASDWALLAGWIHYLAFDLFIGSEFVDVFSGRPIVRTLVMLLTFWFGPVGYLLAKFLSRTSQAAQPLRNEV